MNEPSSYGRSPAQNKAVELMHAWGQITDASRKRARIRPATLEALVNQGALCVETIGYQFSPGSFNVWSPGPRW